MHFLPRTKLHAHPDGTEYVLNAFYGLVHICGQRYVVNASGMKAWVAFPANGICRFLPRNSRRELFFRLRRWEHHQQQRKANKAAAT